MAEFTTFATWKCEICSRPLGEHEGHELRDCNLKLWQLQKAAPCMAELLLESCTSIGGDWRERRDKVLQEAGLLWEGKIP